MTRRLCKGSVLVLCVLPIAVAACGSSSSNSSGSSSATTSKSPDELLKAAQSAVSSAKSVHVSGAVNESKAKVPVEVTVVPGKGVTGKFTYQGHPIEVIEVDKALYIKGGGALFSQLPASETAALSGKWLEIPLSGPLTAAFGKLTHFETQVKEPLLKLKGTTLKSTGTKTIEGTAATGLQATNDPTVTVYVANAEPNYPVAVETTGANASKLVFGDWNKEVTLTAPSGAVELTKVLGGVP